jgi:hypothetical protein
MVLDVGARLGIIAQGGNRYGLQTACDTTRGQRMPSDARDQAPPPPIRTVSSQLGRFGWHVHHLATMLVATCGRLDPPVLALAQRQGGARRTRRTVASQGARRALRNVANYVAKGQLDVNLRAAAEISNCEQARA